MKLAAFLSLALSAAWGAQPALGQAYPTKPARLIVPANPSGPAEVVTRQVSEHFLKAFGQPLVIEYVPGVAGILGMQKAAKASPDGYTFVRASQGYLSLGPALYAGKVSFDYVKDFDPVVLLASLPYVLVVTPSVPAGNLKELLAHIRSQPGKFNFASTNGTGGSSHVTGELFRKMGKLDIVHVPFKGDAAAQIAVMSGDVQMVFSLSAGVTPNIRSGRLKAIAIGSARRLSTLPEVPTLEEAGMPGFRAGSWFALMAPAGTPAPIARRVNEEVNRLLEMPDVRAKLLSMGTEPGGGTVAELASHVKSERERWGQVIREANIRLDTQ
jgi:tripartite-type tricarboxylate transporter receptor subunit TctC